MTHKFDLVNLVATWGIELRHLLHYSARQPGPHFDVAESREAPSLGAHAFSVPRCSNAPHAGCVRSQEAVRFGVQALRPQSLLQQPYLSGVVGGVIDRAAQHEARRVALANHNSLQIRVGQPDHQAE